MSIEEEKERRGIPPWDYPIGAIDTAGIASGFWMYFPGKFRQQLIDEHGLETYGEIELALGKLLRDMVESGALLLRQRWLTPKYRSIIAGRGTPQARTVRSWWECRFCKRESEDPYEISHDKECHLMVGRLSRTKLAAKDPGHEVFVGWDDVFKTHFAQLYGPKPENTDEDRGLPYRSMPEDPGEEWEPRLALTRASKDEVVAFIDRYAAPDDRSARARAAILDHREPEDYVNDV